MGGVDGDTALALFGSGVDVGIGFGLRPAALCQNVRDGRGQARLAVVHVTDRADIDVRLDTLKLRFTHNFFFPCARKRARRLKTRELSCGEDAEKKAPDGNRTRYLFFTKEVLYQ